MVEIFQSRYIYITSIRNILPDVEDGTSSLKSEVFSSVDDLKDIERLWSFGVDSDSDVSSIADDLFCAKVTKNAMTGWNVRYVLNDHIWL